MSGPPYALHIFDFALHNTKCTGEMAHLVGLYKHFISSCMQQKLKSTTSGGKGALNSFLKYFIIPVQPP